MKVQTNEYSLTDVEAREEAAARMAVLTGKSPAEKRKSAWRGWFAWILFVVFVVAVQLLMRLSNVTAPAVGTLNSASTMPAAAKPEFSMSVDFWGLLSCSSAVPLWLLGLVLAIRPANPRARMPFEELPAPERWRQKFLIAVTFLAMGLMIAAAILLEAQADWTLNSRQFIMIQAAPWLVLLIVIILRGRWLKGRAPTSLGAANSPARLPQRCTFADEGVELTCEECTTVYRWSHFVSYLETPRLLVLYTRGVMILMPPKQAFASEADLISAKALVQTHIERGQFIQQAGGFPVLPAGPRPVETV
ncbi:MAG: YcxB family protein [Tepidisphaeraceae bacterium]